MLYGERLKMAMEKRSGELGREVTRKEVAEVAGCSVQNIGMILTNAKGDDQVLKTLAHARVCRFLRVNPDWLLEEIGGMDPVANSPGLSQSAQDIAELYDTIPVSNRMGRIQAFNEATMAIMRVLRPSAAKDPSDP